MENLNDFDLDVTIKKRKDGDADVQVTSKSFCTPGCITGVLMCVTQSCWCSYK